VAQALRPFPQYLTITNLSNRTATRLPRAADEDGTAHFPRADRRGGVRVSKTLTDADVAAGGGPAGQTYYNRGLEKAVSDTDVPQAVSISFLYDLPFGAAGASSSTARWAR